MGQKKSENQKIPSILRSVTNVQTGENGKLIQPTKQLESNTQYVICKDVPVDPAKAMESREKIAEWIDCCVLGDLRTVILGIEERRKRDETQPPALGGCNFLLAACCCMALEYFGQVYGQGKNATESVQKYVEDFLIPIDPQYEKFWPIFWRSFRNGVVHGSWPQRIRMQGSPEEEQIAMRANNSPNGDHFDRDSDRSDRSFAISSDQLFRDIERSFCEGFRSWILNESDEGILERAAPRLLEIKRGDIKGKTAFEHIERIVSE